MKKNLLVLIGLGAVAYYLWYMNKKKNIANKGIQLESIKNVNKEIPVEIADEIVKQATDAQKAKYTNAFRKQFNIKLPAVQASKEVKKAAFRMQDKRYARQLQRQLEKPEVDL